jgi:creatinine amidohydrolase
MAEVELVRMTWREAEEARDRGAVVLMPIGTLEQNGSVCPLGVDTLVAEEVAKRVARETEAVVTPAITFGYSPQFRHFPGTISLSPDTLRKLVVDASVNMLENGFTHILFVNCHISNEPIIEHAARELREQYGVLTGWVNPIYLAQAASKDLYAGKEDTLGHGAEPIASMLRSFDPEAVKLDAAQHDQWGEYQGLTVAGSSKVKVGGAVFGLFFGTEEAAETGGTGDPTASDPERGAEIMRRVVDQTSDFVRTFSGLAVIDEE